MASASSRSARARARARVMGEGAPLSKLPDEVVERVLSFLPLPTLCRLRTVCKGWNDLLCGPSFHGLYENQCREVIFLTRFKLIDYWSKPYTKLDSRMEGKTCFLDLAERRWYSIRRYVLPEFNTRTLAVADGLVAASWCEMEEADDYGFVKISNPFLDLNRILRPPFCLWPSNDSKLPTLVVAKDRSRSLRIFLMDNNGHDELKEPKQLLWIHESGKWHPARHPPNPKCDGATNPKPTPEMDKITMARSAVVFCGDLYAILSPHDSNVCFLMKYGCEKDIWTVIQDDAPNQSAHPQLLVSGNRLFMRFWRSGATLDSRLFEIVEIVENVSRPVLQVPSASLERFFGEPVDELACVVPGGVRSDGSCSTVALVSGSSGRVVVYDVVSGSADILPVHPLGGVDLYPGTTREWYWATNTNMRWRDFLLPRTALLERVF